MYHTALICKRKVIIVSRQQKIISEVGVFSTETLTREENNAIIPHEIVFAGKAILVLNEKNQTLQCRSRGQRKFSEPGQGKSKNRAYI